MLTVQLFSGQQEKRKCKSKEEFENEERKLWLPAKRGVERGVCRRVLGYHLYLSEYDSHRKNLSYSVFSFVF